MTANSASSPARFFATMLFVMFVVVMVPLAFAAFPGAMNVPAPEGVNTHAVLKHPDAEWIWASYESEQYECLRVYRSVTKNRLLYRFTYSGRNLEGGIITTTSGAPVTAYMRTAAGWDRVIVRDGFVLVLSHGICGEAIA